MAARNDTAKDPANTVNKARHLGLLEAYWPPMTTAKKPLAPDTVAQALVNSRNHCVSEINLFALIVAPHLQSAASEGKPEGTAGTTICRLPVLLSGLSPPSGFCADVPIILMSPGRELIASIGTMRPSNHFVVASSAVLFYIMAEALEADKKKAVQGAVGMGWRIRPATWGRASSLVLRKPHGSPPGFDHARRLLSRSLKQRTDQNRTSESIVYVPGVRGKPSSWLTSANCSTAKSRSSRVWAAETCVRILARPFGTTGKEKPIT